MSKLLREDKSKKPDFTYFAVMYNVSERIAKRFQEGAEKYDYMNWRYAESTKTYQESAMRHLFQHFYGRDDEDHLAAAIVNLMIIADLEDG